MRRLADINVGSSGDIPANAQDGQFWIDSDTRKAYVRLGSAWVGFAQAFGTASSATRIEPGSFPFMQLSGESQFFAVGSGFAVQTARSGMRSELTASYLAFGEGGTASGYNFAYNIGTGIWLGIDHGTAALEQGTPRFFMGAADANKVTWDGTTLGVVGSVVAEYGELQNLTVTGTLTLDGSGKIITDASPNPRIEMGTAELAGYSDATTKEFYIDAATGKAFAGGGDVILDQYGIKLAGDGKYEDSIAWLNGDGKICDIYGWDENVGGNDIAHMELRSPYDPEDVYEEGRIRLKAAMTMTESSLQLYSGGSAVMVGDLRMDHGLYVGGTTTNPGSGDIVIAGDLYAGGGITVGHESEAPADKTITFRNTTDPYPGATPTSGYGWLWMNGVDEHLRYVNRLEETVYDLCVMTAEGTIDIAGDLGVAGTAWFGDKIDVVKAIATDAGISVGDVTKSPAQGLIMLKEVTAPGSPPSGYGRMYIDSSTSKLMFKDDSGVAHDLASGTDETLYLGVNMFAADGPSTDLQQPDLASYEFDGAADEEIYCTVPLPTGWAGLSDVTATILWSPKYSTSSNFDWVVRCACLHIGSAWPYAVDAGTISVGGGALTNKMFSSDISIDLSSWSEGDGLAIRVGRLGASDSANGLADFHALKMTPA